MKNEILRPCAPSAPMNELESVRAKRGPIRVTIGASAARKMTNSSTRMKMIEKNWISFPCCFDCLLLATLVATAPDG